MTIYEFDRYINGQLMAEGVTIEKAKSLGEATAAAARIASKGPKGEAPVLVLRREPAAIEAPDTPADAEAHLTALLRAEYKRGVRDAASEAEDERLDSVGCNPANVAVRIVVRILALLTQEGR